MRKKLKKALSVLSALAMTIAAIPAVELPITATDTTTGMALYKDIDNDSVKVKNNDNVIQLDESVLANDCPDDSELQEIFTQVVINNAASEHEKTDNSELNSNESAVLNTNSNYLSDGVYDLKAVYDNAETYAADCSLLGFVDPQNGTRYDYKAYEQVALRNYSYEEFANGILENKWLAYTGQVYTVLTKVISDSPNAVNNLTPQAMYEVILMDYLNYKIESDEKNGDLAKKIAINAKKLADKYIDYRLDKGLDVSKESVLNMTIEEAEEFTKKWEKYDMISKDIGFGIDVYKKGKDYVNDLIKLISLIEANDENVNFLLDIKSKASADGNKDLCNAIDVVVAKIDASFLDVIKTTYDNAVEIAMEKAWGLVTSDIPFMSGIKLSIGVVNKIFKTDEIAANNIKVLLFYTIDGYARSVMYDKSAPYYSAGFKNEKLSEKDAAEFNNTFSSFAKWQGYASDFAGSFASALNNGGWFQKVKNAFSSKSKQQKEYWESRIKSDKTFADGAVKLINNFKSVYINYVGYSDLFMTEVEVPTEKPESVSSDITLLSDPKYYTYVVNESTALTSDVECADLILNGSLDLNGHTLVVNNDVVIDCDIDLNGGNLTVNGDTLHKDGEVNVNNGIFNVYGNYFMQNPTKTSADILEYGSCESRVIMTNTYDKMNINGNISMHNCNSYSGWTSTGEVIYNAFVLGENAQLSISGNIWSDCGFCKRSNGKIILNGTGEQHIHLEGIHFSGSYWQDVATHNSLANLEVVNPENREIVCDGYITANFLSDINIRSNGLSLYNMDVNKHNMVINGDCVFNSGMTYYDSVIDINAGSITINGNVLQQSGKVNVNNGTLNINGNYTMEDTSKNNVGEIVYNDCYSCLNMTQKYDKVNISGDFTTHNLESGKITFKSGVLKIDGDIWSDKGFYAENSDEKHKLVLNGLEDQNVYTAGDTDYYSSFFNQVEVKNSEKRNIIWNGILSAKEFVNDINIKTDNLECHDFDLNKHNMKIDGKVTITSLIDINGGILTINGYVTETGNIDINGGVLTINGDLLQQSGEVNVNNGTLNIDGNYAMENTTKNNVDETIYNDCRAQLYMKNEYDNVNISGDFTTHNLKYGEGVYLGYGTLSVGGDIWSDGGISASSNYNSKVVLNGLGTQKVYMKSGSFNELEVTNPASHTIVYSGILNINKIVSDINIKTDNLECQGFDLNKHNMIIDGKITITNVININGGILTIDGDVLIDESVYLNKGTLAVNGNITHKAGKVSCSNGTLNVNGNYSMEDTTENNIGKVVYNACYAELYMENEYDIVNISGDFTTHNLGRNYLYYYVVYLGNGTLSVGGDIWSDGRISTPSNSGHKTVLTGDKKQSITINENETFNIIELTKNKSNYSFNPDPCWRELIETKPVITTPVTTAPTTTTTTTIKTTTVKPITTTVKTTTKPPVKTTTTKPITITTKVTTTSKATTVPPTTAKTTTKPIVTTTSKITTTPKTTTVPPTTTVATKPLGDVNGDNKTSVADVVILQRYLVKKVEFTDAEWKLADMNSDGKVNVFDVIILKRKLLK